MICEVIFPMSYTANAIDSVKKNASGCEYCAVDGEGGLFVPMGMEARVILSSLRSYLFVEMAVRKYACDS